MKKVYECSPNFYARGKGMKFVSTGEERAPKEGEWHLGKYVYPGYAAYANFDSSGCSKFLILKPYKESLYRRCLNWFKSLKG